MKRNVRKHALASPLFLGVWVLALLLVPTAARTSAADAARSGEPVAIRVQFEPGPELQEAYWLAGLASTPGDFPDVLGLVWARVPLSWFGSTWGLHLVSAQGLLPNNLAADGSGPLSGLKFYTLASVNPASGHRYEAVLSYDPLSGAVALRVGDVTEGRTLVERGLTLAPYSGVYYSTPAETGSHMVVDVHSRFEPYGLNWRLVQPEPDGVHISVDVVDRRRPVHVRLLSPWNELPGGVRLQIGDSEIGRIEGIGNETLFPLVLDGLPAGHYDARLDYLYRDEVVASFVRPFHLGVVEARLEGIEIHVGGPDEIQIRGDVVLTADGPVRDVTVALDAVLSRVELEARDYGTTFVFTSELESRRRVLERSIPTLDETEVRLPFAATLSVSDVQWPYRIWELALVPEVSTAAGVRTGTYEDVIRVYAVAPPEPDGTLRVMTYNIHHGEGMDGRIDLQRLADVMAYSGADIIGLQEVDVRTRRSMGVDQLAALAELLHMESAFGWNLLYQGGYYGNALLSRYPILSSNNINLYWAGGEPRGMLRAVVDVDGSPLTVYVTHLGLDARERDGQRRQIVDRLRGTDGPFVLLGDMNESWSPGQEPLFADAAVDAWLQAVDMSEPSSPLRLLGTLGSTFSSTNPNRRIDYIFLSHDLAVTGESAVFTIQTQASDHLPVVAEIEWKN